MDKPGLLQIDVIVVRWWQLLLMVFSFLLEQVRVFTKLMGSSHLVLILAQQAAAQEEEVTVDDKNSIIDVVPLTGPQKVGPQFLSLTANRQAKTGTGGLFGRELPMRKKRRASPRTGRMVKVRVTIQ